MNINPKRSWKVQEFMAHGTNINCLALGRKSGRVLVTGGEDKKVNLWAIGQLDCIMSLSGHVTSIKCVKFGPLENKVCAGSEAGVIKLWDLEAAKLFRRFTGHKTEIKCIDFCLYSSQSEFLASGSIDKCIKLWDCRSSKNCIFTYKGHDESVNSIKFSPDGQWIASGGEDGKVKIWDIRIGKVLKEFIKHSGPVIDVEFHPEEFLLASSSVDRSVHFWDLEHFNLVSKTEKETSPIQCLHFSSKGDCLFGGCIEQLKVFGWEPARIFDTVSIGWGKVQDIAVTQEQLIGASFKLSNVLVCVVNIMKVVPFVTSTSNDNQVSPFVYSQSVRKSFNKQKSNEFKPKVKVKVIEEEYDIEDDPAVFVVSNSNNYETVFKPSRSLNRSPPLSSFLNIMNEDNLSKLSFVSNNPIKYSNIKVLPCDSSKSFCVSPIEEKSYRSLQTIVTQSSIKNIAQESSDENNLSETNLPPTCKVSMLENNLSYLDYYSNTLNSFTIPMSNSSENQSILTNSKINVSCDETTNIASVAKKSSTSSFKFNEQVHPSDSDLGVLCPKKNKLPSENCDEIVPTYCETAVNLHLEEFLPISYQKEMKSNQSYSNLSESEIISSLNRNHEVLLTILKIRQRNLQIIYSLWHRQDLKCALEGAISMNDEAVLVDILSAINKRPALWNLDVCVVLLPVLCNLLRSKYEIYMSVSCDSLQLILKNFLSVIIANMQWASPTIGVDISKEERYSKCVKCYDSLISIRTFLLKRQTMQGKIGQSFREIQSLLYAIEK